MSAKAKIWAGRGLSGLAVTFLVFDAFVKIIFLPDMPEASEQLGWSAHAATPLGILLLICTLLYVVPRTSTLGAILLTGYLGGAVATHARIESPLFTHILFGVYLGMIIWGGLYLRDERLRQLLRMREAG